MCEYVKEWVGLSVYVEGCINIQKGVARGSIQPNKIWQDTYLNGSINVFLVDSYRHSHQHVLGTCSNWGDASRGVREGGDGGIGEGEREKNRG